jgi:hypothetical protein
MIGHTGRNLYLILISLELSCLNWESFDCVQRSSRIISVSSFLDSFEMRETSYRFLDPRTRGSTVRLVSRLGLNHGENPGRPGISIH